MTVVKHSPNYLGLEKMRVFYNENSDSLELSGKIAGTKPFKTVLQSGSDLEKQIREEMKAAGLITSEVETVDEGLPESAALDYSEKQFTTMNIALLKGLDKKHLIQNAAQVTPLSEKLSIPIGIVKGEKGEQLSFKKVDFFQKENGNIFVSGEDGWAKTYFTENIENHMLMFSPESEIITFNPSRMKPDMGQAPRHIKYNDSLDFLSRLRRIRALYERNHEQERNILVFLHNPLEVLKRPFEDEISPAQERVEKAVRSEILDLIMKITDYNAFAPNLKTTFVITSNANNLPQYMGILSRCTAVVRFGNASSRLSKALFGVKTGKISEAVPGRGYALSRGHLMPFQAFFPTGGMDDAKANENFRKRFEF